MNIISKKILIMSMSVALIGAFCASNAVQAIEISDTKKEAIINKCDSIKNTLRTLQHNI